MGIMRIATMLRRDPAARAVLEKEGATMEAIPDGPAKRALLTFLDLYGDRAVREAEISTPRWKEDPRPVFTMIRVALRGDAHDAERHLARAKAAADAEMQRLFKRLNFAEQTAVRHLVARAQKAARLRERMRTWVTRVLGMIRDVALDADRRLLRLVPELAQDWSTLKRGTSSLATTRTVTGAANVVPSGPSRHAANAPGPVAESGVMLISVSAASAPSGITMSSLPSALAIVPPAGPIFFVTGAPAGAPTSVTAGVVRRASGSSDGESSAPQAVRATRTSTREGASLAKRIGIIIGARDQAGHVQFTRCNGRSPSSIWTTGAILRAWWSRTCCSPVLERALVAGGSSVRDGIRDARVDRDRDLRDDAPLFGLGVDVVRDLELVRLDAFRVEASARRSDAQASGRRRAGRKRPRPSKLWKTAFVDSVSSTALAVR